MRRIGIVTYTARPKKGTSRAKRRAEMANFRLTAKIVNYQHERMKLVLDRAAMDKLIFGEARVKITWDGDVENMAPDAEDEL